VLVVVGGSGAGGGWGGHATVTLLLRCRHVTGGQARGTSSTCPAGTLVRYEASVAPDGQARLMRGLSIRTPVRYEPFGAPDAGSLGHVTRRWVTSATLVIPATDGQADKGRQAGRREVGDARRGREAGRRGGEGEGRGGRRRGGEGEGEERRGGEEATGGGERARLRAGRPPRPPSGG
jgi:hypothetical protein